MMVWKANSNIYSYLNQEHKKQSVIWYIPMEFKTDIVFFSSVFIYSFFIAIYIYIYIYIYI